ncbi:DUF3156 family protein [Photobacterium sp. ZSDE20]|uniref:DUF3156 family protein n=1 Tax=Photobacterium pectinilyticum TaxID=2906793 RepID=A0ABT1N818_9GAMM|nr:DUF3156 family protein [Photobacterium sp. ZSDE20]MCQ1060871.1 DUF3156 family protein [Photobacterium sp. ZSDE20]MDD1828739.1 DUF3156 family protein [Photobacterium sp. ZSDE20]
MSAKPNAFNMAQSAIYTHAQAFSPYWGEARQSAQGVVHFSRLPAGLKTLQIKPGFTKRWMGGTCAMNILFSHPVAETSQSRITFKGARGGVFVGKTNDDLAARVSAALEVDRKLKNTLLAIDLDSLVIEFNDGVVTCTLTPYGGGMAYLVMPPIRTPIPLPAEQILPLTQALETISQHIVRCQH